VSFLLIAGQHGVAAAQVSGTVTATAGGGPIEGARVTLQATATTTTTAVDGTFTLDATGTDLVVVVAHKGYFNTSVTVTSPATNADVSLEAVPQADDSDYVFQSSGTCGVCHGNQQDQFQDTPMARAGHNTWVHDIYDGSGTTGGMGGFVYTRDSPHATANPNSECAACHQPISWIQNPGAPMGDLDNPDAGLNHGVTCEVCHKIANVDETKPNYPGVIADAVTFTRPTPGWQVVYGVLGDVDFTDVDGSRMRASLNPQLTAVMCGTCHQDKNDPDGDGDFEGANGVISEPTFLEWKNSPYGDPTSSQYQTCVDCHMPSTGETTACTVLSDDLGRSDTQVRSHKILGTTPAYLENAVTMSMTTSVDDDGLTVDVSIVNDQTGHSVPTGVTIRNMILLVEVTMANGASLTHTGTQVLHDLAGVGDPTQGYFGGMPGKLYGKLNHGPDGTGPVFFTDATGIQFDTRIVALATDNTSYTFALPEFEGNATVRARLIYRRSWRALVDAKGWTTDGHGNPLADVTAPHFGHLMEETTEIVALPGLPEPPEEDGCCSVGERDPESTFLLFALVCIVIGRRRRRTGG